MQKNTALIAGWIVFAAVLAVIWFLRLQSIPTVVFALLASLIGFVLPIFLDILLPKIMDGSAQTSTSFAKEVLQAGADQVKQGNIHQSDPPKTPLRSYPLLVAYIVASIFVITSTQNWFGRGFVMGLGFSLVGDIFFSRNPITLRERWFSVFRTNLSDGELRYFVWITIASFGVLTLLAALA